MKKKAKRGTDGFQLNWNGLNHAFSTLEKQASVAYKRLHLSKEVKHYADGIVHTLTRADFLPNRNKLIREARHNMEKFIKKIQKSDVASKALDLASNKGNKVLSLLNFPTKKDVSRLNARLNQLEKRLKGLRPHAHR